MGMLDGSKKGKGKATQVDGKEVDTTSPLPLQICRDKEMLDASRKGKGKATQIDNNLSNRSLPQRVRRERERERLIALSHFEPTNRHLPPLIIREGGIEGTTITVVPETPNQVEKVEENETQQQQPRAGQIDLGRWFESP